MIAKDDCYLSPRNPIANAEQLALEDRALRLIQHPQVVKARDMAGFLFARVHAGTPAEHMRRFEQAVDEYVFNYAMRAVASDAEYPGIVRFMTPTALLVRARHSRIALGRG